MTILILSAIGWGIIWNNTKESLEEKFENGVEINEFRFDKQLGHYKKVIDEDTYYTLPNQSMPGYFDFVLHFHNAVLDYYTEENEENIQIRWSGKNKDEELEHTVFCLDKYGNYKYTLSEIQEKELRETNPNISTVLKDGKKIYESIYFKN